MVSIPLMLGLFIATFGLGYALSLRRHYGWRWPDRALIILAVLTVIAAGLIYAGLP